MINPKPSEIPPPSTASSRSRASSSAGSEAPTAGWLRAFVRPKAASLPRRLLLMSFSAVVRLNRCFSFFKGWLPTVTLSCRLYRCIEIIAFDCLGFVLPSWVAYMLPCQDSTGKAHGIGHKACHACNYFAERFTRHLCSTRRLPAWRYWDVETLYWLEADCAEP